MLKARGLTVKFKEVFALKEVSVEFSRGEMCAIFGANGSGKTTLLKSLAGLERVTEGKITYLGEDITNYPPRDRVKRGIQYIPDRARVGLKMTVEENLEIGGFLREKSEVAGAVEEVFNLFPEIEERRDDLAGILSGGQRQMLVIGRAYVSTPKVMLFDEPLFGLSKTIRRRIFSLLSQLKEIGTTIIMAEHDIKDILPLSDRYMVFINGKIVKQGSGGPAANPEGLKKAIRKFYSSGGSCG